MEQTLTDELPIVLSDPAPRPLSARSRNRRATNRLARLLQVIAVVSTSAAVLTSFVFDGGFEVLIAGWRLGLGWFASLWAVASTVGFVGLHWLTIARPAIATIDADASVESETLDQFLARRTEYTEQQKRYLLELICLPKTHLRRITETVRFIDRQIEIERTLVVDSLAEERSPFYVIPVHWVKKGSSVDGLRIVDKAGRRLSTLAAEESADLVLSLMVDLVMMSKEGRALTAEDQLDLLVCSQSIVSESDPARAGVMYREAMAEGSAFERFAASSDAGGFLQILVGRLTELSPLFVAVDALRSPNRRSARHRQIAYRAPRNTRTLRPARRISVTTLEAPAVLRHRFQNRQLSSRFAGFLVDFVEGLLFVEPAKMSVSVAAAERTRHYHLNMIAPRGMHVYNMRLGRVLGGSGKASMALADEKHAFGRNLAGYGQLYLRDAQRTTGYHAVTTFRERIPGSITEAMLLSGVILLLIASVLFAHGGSVSQLFSVLLPTVFLTVGTGTIWRTVNQVGEVYQGRLASRLSSLATFGLAAAAVVFSSIDSSKFGSGCRSNCPAWSPIPWAILLAVASGAFVFVAAAWLVDLLVERDLMRASAVERIDKSVRSLNVGSLS